jgi:hypothetical protein
MLEREDHEYNVSNWKFPDFFDDPFSSPDFVSLLCVSRATHNIGMNANLRALLYKRYYITALLLLLFAIIVIIIIFLARRTF